MDSLQALDAVISGHAYEYATAAIGIIEEGPDAAQPLTTEMLCTLDNFIKVLLFNERVVLTGCADLVGDLFLPKKPIYGANNAGQRLLLDAQIFLPEQQFSGYLGAVEERVARTLQPLDPQQFPLFMIQCEFPQEHRTLLQEMVYLDAYFIEYAIEQYGAERFKPVFPGEHLYLGLRREKVTLPRTTHTVADVLGRRLREIVHQRMTGLKELVPQWAHLLPDLPPLFVTRILRECDTGADFVPTLLAIRNSPALTGFRQWLAGCRQLAASSEHSARQRAADAYTLLDQFEPKKEWPDAGAKLAVLDQADEVPAMKPVESIAALVAPIVTYLGHPPCAGLQQLAASKVTAEQLKQFFHTNFGAHYSPHEMQFISTLLKLPGNLTDWGQETATFSLYGVELNPAAAPLARPCYQRVNDATYGKEALMGFDELFSSVTV